jgi:hypothetical protein
VLNWCERKALLAGWLGAGQPNKAEDEGFV